MSVDIEPKSTSIRESRRRRRPGTSAEPPAATPEPPRMPGRRNPKWIALGIIALSLGGLLSYVIYARVATETTVVAMADTVYRGEVIEQQDLTTLMLRAGSIAQAVPADDLKTMIGKRAAVDLVEGSVVITTAITTEAVPGEGRAVVGLKLAAGRTPTSLLVPSSAVRLVALPAESGSDKLAGDTFIGMLIDQAPGSDGTSILINVDVPADQAPTIALLAAQDRIALIRDAGR